MADIRSKLNEIYSIEAISKVASPIHKINPGIKMLVTLVYIITVISFDRYSFFSLSPYIFYPIVITAIGNIPISLIFKRTLVALPFAFFAGIANLIFDSGTIAVFFGINISFGFVSFWVLMFRTILCVSAVLILIASTPFSQLTSTLKKLHIPTFLILMFEMIYRYISVLVGEASNMYTAYTLRSTEGKGLKMNDMGTFIGSLFIRSYDRSERIYSAMKLRGYGSHVRNNAKIHIIPMDIIFLIATVLPIILLRIFNIY